MREPLGAPAGIGEATTAAHRLSTGWIVWRTAGGDFHADQDVIQDILARLTRDEALNAYPARLRAKDGSTKYVMINSNVYREKGGEFGHTRCFTTEIGEAAWKALKSNK
jgi:hypothetical protein